MKTNKRRLYYFLLASFISLFYYSNSAYAQIVPDGDYYIAIKTTPPFIPGVPIPDVGFDGNWNSSFTFNGVPRIGASHFMLDNGVLVFNQYGSSVPGDGFAGILKINVTGTHIAVNFFQVDTIQNTLVFNFAQYGPSNQMSGTIDQTNGKMTLDLTGRLASIDGLPNYIDLPLPGSFTTDSASSIYGVIHGARITPIGDINSDGRMDFHAILVAMEQFERVWRGLWPAVYVETWNIDIISGNIFIPGVLDVSIEIDGGISQECNQAGGSTVSIASNVSNANDAVITEVIWEIDGQPAGSFTQKDIFLPLGDHLISVKIHTEDGRTASNSKVVSVTDTTPPTIDAGFIDSKTNQPITVIDKPNVHWVKTRIRATDVCDSAPTITGQTGVVSHDDDLLKIKGNLNLLELTTTEIKLDVKAVDSNGNMSNSSQTLMITE